MPQANYPIELTAPDISPYKAGNTGIEYFTCFDSGKPGPHVMITAVVHGNEVCGAIALDWLFSHDVRPLKGKLSLGFMNTEAYLSFDPANPTVSRFIDEDFNRLWTAQALDDPARNWPNCAGPARCALIWIRWTSCSTFIPCRRRRRR